MNSKILWSVIIPTYNRYKSLQDTLLSLIKQDLHSSSYEIIVVDNGSTDSTKEIIYKYKNEFPSRNIIYIYTKFRGLLFGRHEGAKAASSDILTFVDDDVLVRPDYGLNIIHAFNNNEDTALVSGPCRPKYLVKCPDWVKYYINKIDDGIFCIPLSLMDKGNAEVVIDPQWVWGLNFSVRKNILWQLGGFHPDGVPDDLLFFRGDGEYGLAQSAMAAGLKARYIPGASVEHVISSHRLTENYFARRFFAQGISDSYTDIRRAGGLNDLGVRLPVIESDSVQTNLHARLHNAYVDGYFWHQKAVCASPALLDWVLRPTYLDTAYPSIAPEISAPRPWSKILKESPHLVLQDTKQYKRLIFAYYDNGRTNEANTALKNLRIIKPDAMDWDSLELLLRQKDLMNQNKLMNILIEKAVERCGKEAVHFASLLSSRMLKALNDPLDEENSLDFYAYDDETAKQKDHYQNIKERNRPIQDILISSLQEYLRQILTKYYLFNLLADDQSRSLLVDIAAFQILGHNYIRLPYHKKSNKILRRTLTEQTSASQNDIETLKVLKDISKDASGNYGYFDLEYIGTPIRLYSSDEEIFRVFFAPSYVYSSLTQQIAVEKNDVVLDCGACLCDTALFFALATGKGGQVISFEPIPSNLAVATKNLQLNPYLAERIVLVEAATGREQGTVDFMDWGPASHRDPREGFPIMTVPITTLDSTVKSYNLPRVDFIKMDIEGAELEALQGAEGILRKFRPKLAISLYHRPEDFMQIPAWIHSLKLGYNFFLQHHYVNQFETVLYASV